MAGRRIQRGALWAIQSRSTIYVGPPTVFTNPWKVATARRRLVIDGPGIHFLSTDDFSDAHALAVATYRDWLERGEQCRVLKGRRDSETDGQREQLEARRRRILGQLKTLADRDLACWCHRSLACHVDVLLELANGLGA